MNSKKLISTIAAAIIATASYANDTDKSSELELLRQQVAQQKEALQRLEGRLNSQQEQFNRLDSVSYSQEKEEAPILKLNKHISNLSIKGDLRIRYEKRDVDDEERDRFRQRLRLGLKWKSEDENFEIGVGLATGGGDATSTNDTYSEKFPYESGDLRVDYAYAKHTWDDIDVIVGQMKNPFVTSAIVWDSDVRPVGAVVQYNAPDLKNYKTEGFFATAGAFDYAYSPDNDDDKESFLAAGQIGMGIKADNINSIIAASAYLYDSKATDANSDFDQSEIDYDFQIIDLVAKANMKLADDMKLDIFGHVAANIGTDSGDESIMNDSFTGDANGVDEDADDNNMAYAIGAKLSINDFYVGAEFRHVEADAVNSWVSDSDFGTGTEVGLDSNTNVEGFVAKVGYKFSKNVSVQLAALFYEEIEDVTSGDNDDGTLYQLDLKYKF